MEIEVNFWIWAAQVSRPFSAIGTVGTIFLAFAWGISSMVLLSEEDLTSSDAKSAGAVRRFTGPALLLCALVAIAATLVPSRETLIYSGALQYGPEYADRILSILEAK